MAKNALCHMLEGYFQFERAVSLYNSFFLFPVATAL
jgi:hypothetical protein